jgi:hypothetical protein
VLVVDLAAASCTSAVIGKLKELLAAHPGTTPVHVRFLSSNGVTPLEVGSFRVNPGPGLLSELRLLLGTRAARLEPALVATAVRVVQIPEDPQVPAGARPPSAG